MATANFSFLSTITGASEGGNDLINITETNSSAVYTITQTTLTTNGITGAISFVIPTGASKVFIVPPSTNPSPMRIGQTTGDSTGHLQLSSVGASILAVSTNSTVVLWTTATTILPNIRVIVV